MKQEEQRPANVTDVALWKLARIVRERHQRDDKTHRCTFCGEKWPCAAEIRAAQADAASRRPLAPVVPGPRQAPERQERPVTATVVPTATATKPAPSNTAPTRRAAPDGVAKSGASTRQAAATSSTPSGAGTTGASVTNANGAPGDGASVNGAVGRGAPAANGAAGDGASKTGGASAAAAGRPRWPIRPRRQAG